MQNKSIGLSFAFKWKTVKISPTKCFPRSRCRHASCIHNEYIYVIGGKDVHVSLRDIWRYHIGNSVWEKVQYYGDELPLLEGHTVVSQKRLLFLFGGSFGDVVTDSALWIINPDLKHIRKFHCDMGTPQPCTRRHHSAVVHDKTMYIYGGHIDLKGSSSEFWAFHIDEEEWELIPQRKGSDTPSGRYGHTAVMYGRDMWIYGGMSDLTPKSDFWYYNFHVQKWTKMKTKFGPPPLVGHSAVLVKDCMVIFGGETENVMLCDFWIFSFTNLRWSHIQLSSITPSPRMWHSMVLVTTISNKSESSVRTHSMPYLQNKGTTSRHRRPRTSPVYSSARNRVMPKGQKREGEISNDGDLKVQRPNHLDINMSTENKSVSQTIFPVVMTTPQSKKNIEKSPLMDCRQLSNQSVCSDTSQSSLKGIDNPGLEISTSIDKLTLLNNAEVMDVSSPSEEAVYKLGQDIRSQKQQYIKKGRKSVAGGQAHLCLNDILIPNLIRVKPYSPHSQKDLVIEDLDVCERTYCQNTNRQNKRHWDNTCQKMIKMNHFRQRQFSQENEWNIIGRHTHLESENNHFLIKSRSSSMGSLHETRVECTTSPERPSSVETLISLQERNCFHCWESENGDSPMSNKVEHSWSSGDSDVRIPASVTVASTSFTIDTSTHSSCQNMPAQEQVTQNKDIEESKNSNYQSNGSNIRKSEPTTQGGRKSETTTQDGRKSEPTTKENIAPFLLLFGGKEFKGCNGRREPLPVWKCEIYMRHSDITHGEYHKSSLVI